MQKRPQPSSSSTHSSGRGRATFPCRTSLSAASLWCSASPYPLPVQPCATNVSKRYGGVVALADGTLDVHSGDVVALVGANGSGKSTLSKILTGVVAPDAGQILLDGKPVSFNSPHAARAHGLTAVYQELSLIPDLTVEEN